MDPVFRLHTSLYGLSRGDTDWNNKADGSMEELGHTKVHDTGEDSVYVKPGLRAGDGPLVTVRYSDNFVMTGESE